MMLWSHFLAFWLPAFLFIAIYGYLEINNFSNLYFRWILIISWMAVGAIFGGYKLYLLNF